MQAQEQAKTSNQTDSAVLDQQKYLAQKAAYALSQLWDDDEWSKRKLYSTFATYLPVDKDKGPLEFEALAQAVEKHLATGRDMHDEQFRANMMRQIYKCWNQTLAGMDPITRVAAMTPYPEAGSSGFDFTDFSPSFYLRPLEGAGRFGYISGPRGQALGVGKTDFALRLAEMVLEVGQCIGTNILIKGDVPGIQEVMTLKDLMKVSIRNFLNGKLTTFILDGAPQFMERERATSRGNVVTKKVQYLLRKVGANMIVIAQREGEITTSIADMSVLHVQKLKQTVMTYRKFSEQFTIRGVPGTKIPFETGDFETFETQFDIDGMHLMLSQLAKEERLGQGQLQAILNFLDRDAYCITDTEKKGAAKVLVLNRRIRLTQREIAELIGTSPATLCRWLKELGLSNLEEATA